MPSPYTAFCKASPRVVTNNQIVQSPPAPSPMLVDSTFFVDSKYGVVDGSTNLYQSIEQAYKAFVLSRKPGTIHVRRGTYNVTSNIASDKLTYIFDPDTIVIVQDKITLFDVNDKESFNVTGHANFVIPRSSNSYLLSNNGSTYIECDSINSAALSKGGDILNGPSSKLVLKVSKDVTLSGRSLVLHSTGMLSIDINNLMLNDVSSLITSQGDGTNTVININKVINSSSTPTINQSGGVMSIKRFEGTSNGGAVVYLDNSANLILSIDHLSLNKPSLYSAFSVNGTSTCLSFKSIHSEFNGTVISFNVTDGALVSMDIKKVDVCLTNTGKSAVWLSNTSASSTIDIQSMTMTAPGQEDGIVFSISSPIKHSSNISHLTLNGPNVGVMVNMMSTGDHSYKFGTIVQSIPSLSISPMIYVMGDLGDGRVHISIDNATIQLNDQPFLHIASGRVTVNFDSINIYQTNSSFILLENMSKLDAYIGTLNTNSTVIFNSSTFNDEGSSLIFGEFVSTSASRPMVVASNSSNIFSIKGTMMNMKGKGINVLQTKGNLNLDVTSLKNDGGSSTISVTPGSVDCSIKFNTLEMRSGCPFYITAHDCNILIDGKKVITGGGDDPALTIKSSEGGLNVESSIDFIRVLDGHSIVNWIDGSKPSTVKFFVNSAIAYSGKCIVANTVSSSELWIGGYFKSAVSVPIELNGEPLSTFRMMPCTLIGGCDMNASIVSSNPITINNQGVSCSNLPVVTPVTLLVDSSFIVNPSFV